MKKTHLTLILLSLLFLLIFTACDNQAVPSETEKDTATDAVVTEKETGNADEAPTSSDEKTTEEATEALTDAEETTAAASVSADGTFSNDMYDVIREGDALYLVLSDSAKEILADGLASSAVPSIDFDSPADMMRKILEGDFTELELNQLNLFPRHQDTGKIKMFDLNLLQSPVLPESFQLGGLTWKGTYYHFNVFSPDRGSCVWYILPKENYEDSYYDDFEGTIEGRELTRDEISTFDGVPCRIIEFSTTQVKIRYIWFDISRGEGKEPLHVSLRYVLSYHGSSEYTSLISDTIPTFGYIYSQDNGQYYNIRFNSFYEAPSVEWLSAFALTPYAETVTEP